MARARLRIGVSSCLLGKKVRYDGQHKRDDFLTEVLAPFTEWVPVCPELEVGMGIPRESVRLTGDTESPRMVGTKSGKDWTRPVLDYSRERVGTLEKLDLSGYLLKSDSPSCGMERVRVYRRTGVLHKAGRGVFAEKLMDALPDLPKLSD